MWFIPYETVHGAEDRGDHPATFPVEVAERCIRLVGVNSGTKALDPFCGVNGMVAAARLGMAGIGMDIDPAYCEVAVLRWQELTGRHAALDGGGLAFNEIAAARGVQAAA